MRKLTSAAMLCALSIPAVAQADCGEVSITEMGWASNTVVTNVATFIMEQGYGCDVTIVPSDTVPAVTSVAENGEPDIVTELWLNSAGEAYLRLEEQGKVERLGKVLDPGGVEGWWIPTYLAEEHPELTRHPAGGRRDRRRLGTRPLRRVRGPDRSFALRQRPRRAQRHGGARGRPLQ